MVDNNKFVSLVEDTDNNNNNNSNNNNGNSNNNNNIQYYQQRRNSLTYNPISDSSSNSNNNNNSINNSFSNENINDVPETLTQREYADADYDSDIEDGGVISGIGSDGLVEETTTLIGKETNIIIDNGIIGIGSGGGLTHSGSNVIITVKEDIITTTTTTKHKKPQGMCYDGRRNYILMVDCLYSLLFAPIVYFIHYIPNTVFSTEGEQGEFWKYWYHNIAWSKYFLWMISIISGFAYVAVITEKRTVPFHCRYKRHRDFFQLLFAATIWFAIGGPSRALFGKDDIVTGLKDGITQNTSNGYSAGESFFYNYGFFLSFLLGLHFTYLDRVIFLRYMGDKFGTPSLWKTFKPLELIVLCPIILFILSLAALHIYLLIQDHLWEYFAIGYAIFFVVLIGVSVLIRKTYYLHMHHYFIFGTMIPLCGFQTALSIFSLGVVSGISVEGISRWSFGWLWYRGVREL